MKKIFNPLAIAALCAGIAACGDKNSTSATGTASTATAENVNEKLAAAAPDFRSYDQYINCKIDGQPYTAYWAQDHITGISNPLNMASRTDFATSADQVEINGKTKISELQISFYTLNKKGAGEYESTRDFYVQGHTDFPQGTDLKYVRFASGKGQKMTVSSFKDGVVEGTFNMDVVDEADAAHILKITDGVFKFKLEGESKIQVDKNGDVNMDSLINSF